MCSCIHLSMSLANVVPFGSPAERAAGESLLVIDNSGSSDRHLFKRLGRQPFLFSSWRQILVEEDRRSALVGQTRAIYKEPFAVSEINMSLLGPKQWATRRERASSGAILVSAADDNVFRPTSRAESSRTRWGARYSGALWRDTQSLEWRPTMDCN